MVLHLLKLQYLCLSLSLPVSNYFLCGSPIPWYCFSPSVCHFPASSDFFNISVGVLNQKVCFYYSPPSHWKLRLSPQFSSLIYAAFICHIWMNSTEMAQDKSRSFLLSDEFLPHSWRTFVGWSQPGSLFNWVKHSLRASGFG